MKLKVGQQFYYEGKRTPDNLRRITKIAGDKIYIDWCSGYNAGIFNSDITREVLIKKFINCGIWVPAETNVEDFIDGL